MKIRKYENCNPHFSNILHPYEGMDISQVFPGVSQDSLNNRQMLDKYLLSINTKRMILFLQKDLTGLQRAVQN